MSKRGIPEERIIFARELVREGASGMALLRALRERFDLTIDEAKRVVLLAHGRDPDEHLSTVVELLQRHLARRQTQRRPARRT